MEGANKKYVDWRFGRKVFDLSIQIWFLPTISGFARMHELSVLYLLYITLDRVAVA